jgi:small subunit ribosomal protein S20
MPQTKQAEKALRQDTKRHEKNRVVKAALKTTLKKTRQAIAAGKVEEASLRKALKDIDKAAQKRLIKKNTAARKKSRLMNNFNKSKASK